MSGYSTSTIKQDVSIKTSPVVSSVSSGLERLETSRDGIPM